jgi:hypothetical protein
MGNQVVTGATLQCSLGTVPATFSATGAKVKATTAGGVVTDVTPSNVPAFGLCTSLSNPQVAAASSAGPVVPQPCVPVLKPWSPGSSTVTIGGVAALDSSSQCSCSWGGAISVKSPGETAVTIK